MAVGIEGRHPVALALVVTGFLLPASQYGSYARLLEDLGMRALTFSDGSTLREPASLGAASAAALEACEAEASRLGLPRSTPLVLLGHSRGCKACVLAAAASARPVAAMLLLDPVDSTAFETASALPALRTLRVPTLVLGSGAGSGDCAPLNANFAAFYAALAAAGAPRLLGFLPAAGHTQFLDARGALLDVCAAGADADEAVRELGAAAIAAWCARFVPGVRERLGPPAEGGLASAGWAPAARAVGRGADLVPALESRCFRAAVTWRAGGLWPSGAPAASRPPRPPAPLHSPRRVDVGAGLPKR